MAAQRLAGVNLVLLLVLGVLWGTAFMFITLGLPSFSPVLFAALRFDIAGVCVLGVALWRRADLRPRTRAQWTAIGVASVLNVGMYHALLFWGQRETTPAVAAVIVGLNPILTTLASRGLLEDERVGAWGILGLGLGISGVVVLATFKPGGAIQGIGELACVAAVASWSVGSTIVRRTKHRMDVFAFTAWQMLVGALLLHASSLAFERDAFAVWDANGIASLLYLAIVSSAIGFIIYFTLLERVGPIRSNLVSYVAPIFAALATFAAVEMGRLPGQPFEWRALGAFVLIAGGFALVARAAPARDAIPPAGRRSS